MLSIPAKHEQKNYKLENGAETQYNIGKEKTKLAVEKMWNMWEGKGEEPKAHLKRDGAESSQGSKEICSFKVHSEILGRWYIVESRKSCQHKGVGH